MVVKLLNTHTQLLVSGYTTCLLLLHMGLPTRQGRSRRDRRAVQGNRLPFTRGTRLLEARAGFTVAAEAADGRGQRIYSCRQRPGRWVVVFLSSSRAGCRSRGSEFSVCRDIGNGSGTDTQPAGV